MLPRNTESKRVLDLSRILEWTMCWDLELSIHHFAPSTGHSHHLTFLPGIVRLLVQQFSRNVPGSISLNDYNHTLASFPPPSLLEL